MSLVLDIFIYLLSRVRDGSSERHPSYRRQRRGELRSRSEKKASPSFDCDENPNSPSTISSPSSPSHYEQKQDFSMSRSKGTRFQEPRGWRPSPKNRAGGDSERGGGQHLEQTIPRGSSLFFKSVKIFIFRPSNDMFN